jgi:hypothetical protein
MWLRWWRWRCRGADVAGNPFVHPKPYNLSTSWPASVPAIHALFSVKKDVDGRDKRGHDVERLRSREYTDRMVARFLEEEAWP